MPGCIGLRNGCCWRVCCSSMRSKVQISGTHKKQDRNGSHLSSQQPAEQTETGDLWWVRLTYTHSRFSKGSCLNTVQSDWGRHSASMLDLHIHVHTHVHMHPYLNANSDTPYTHTKHTHTEHHLNIFSYVHVMIVIYYVFIIRKNMWIHQL